MQTFVVLRAVLLTLGCCVGAQKGIYKSICDPDLAQGYVLGAGANSSVTFGLAPAAADNRTACTVAISAPDTHVIYVRVADPEDVSVAQPEEALSCPLHVYSTETFHRTTWSEDPCQAAPSGEGVLLLHRIQIDWRPSGGGGRPAQGRQLVVTALGKGETCQAENQHACLRVGWTPLLCVAEELVCDGVVHCPPGSQLHDEFCRDQQVMAAANWERIANDFLRKFTGKSKPGNLLPAIDAEDTRWFGLKKNSLAPRPEADDAPEEPPNGISEALAHYGPWGYLMLGMLVCGTILMFCGLWECCCRRPKPPAVLVPTVAPPTAVLVVDGGAEDAQTPPRYEDLDQPPSYDALFPPDQSKQGWRVARAPGGGAQQ